LIGYEWRRKFMSNNELIDGLNRALGLELTAVIQYMQHSFLVKGTEREVYCEFFRGQSREAQKHAFTLGDKIVSLNGLPTAEAGTVYQLTELAEMLNQSLELEKEALKAYMDAWRACDEENLPTKFMLEERIQEEQLHIDELAKICSRNELSAKPERIILRQAV
jgi:bacterioferritin